MKIVKVCFNGKEYGVVLSDIYNTEDEFKAEVILDLKKESKMDKVIVPMKKGKPNFITVVMGGTTTHLDMHYLDCDEQNGTWAKCTINCRSQYMSKRVKKIFLDLGKDNK